MTVITEYDKLPEHLKDDGISVGSGDLQHPYDTSKQQWMAHCQNGGCGEYVDDTDDPPARDFLCAICEEADVEEQ